ncbi:MAG TPA: flagellar basal body P-ring formation chaperone FlgA [Candidatus Didemnitutus sp.]|nr:flagellar basal body P-ring formation chaperone FlgA [Candidatus Didemnitutus sp.]
MRRSLTLSLSLALFAVCGEPLRSVSAETGRSDSAETAEATVTPASPLTQDRFVSALARDLSAHFNLEGDLQLELLRTFTTPTQVAHDWQLVVTEYPAVPTSAMLVRCRMLADGATVGDYTVTMRAALWRDAWVARSPLTVGAIFDATQLESRRTDLFRERDALPAVVGDNTFIFARAVQTGRLLTWRDVARRPLVRKGDFVEVTASEGPLVLTLKAVAMQNGAQGEAITVRNPDSRKDFTAFVIDENRVQVRF